MSTEPFDYLSFGENNKNEILLNKKDDQDSPLDKSDDTNNIQNLKENLPGEIKEGIDLRKSSSSEGTTYKERKNELHKKNQEDAIKKLTIVCIICTIFMIIEIIGGYLANSIAIMSDAAHLLSDLLGFFISIISIYISRKVAKIDMSYGYHRAEIIGALVSVTLIWALTIWLLYEATIRMITTPKVDGLIMIIVATIGFLFNVIMGLVLSAQGIAHNHGLHSHTHSHSHSHHHHGKHEQKHKKQKENENNDVSFDDSQSNQGMKLISEENIEEKSENDNVNLRASLIHVIGDALQNIGVFLAGVIIYIFPNAAKADPICTYIFSIIVGFTTVRILKDCMSVLMEGSPVAIDIESLEQDLKQISGVEEIHDLHVWSLSIGKISLSCHISSENPQTTLKKAKKIIKKKYGIEHVTIQVEDSNQTLIDCKHDLHQ